MIQIFKVGDDIQDNRYLKSESGRTLALWL